MVKGFILCGYARTGGTLLCRALHATGRFGYAQEYFNARAAEPLAGRSYPSNRAAQLLEIERRGTAPNGVYGVKMFADQFDALRGFDWIGGLPNPVFIHLERRDALGQALSNVRALQTNQWNTEQPVRGEAVYDEAAIRAELLRTASYRARWQLFFARNGIEPLWLTYEEVIADLSGAVGRIAAQLGIDDLPDPLPELATLQPQADATNAGWRAKFIASQGDLTVFDSLARAGKRSWAERLFGK